MINANTHPPDELPAGLDARAIPSDYATLAASSEEAEDRYRKTILFDPFPDIAPSLLNFADIYDYVRLTGMIFPFETDRLGADGKSEKTLKSASYEVPIGQKCMFWNPNDSTWNTVNLKDADEFILQPNSIAFVQIQPRIRLPAYIALRFNLRIKHVHRGILLGTGPLVDPGFDGDLLIPIHNLTTNAYSIKKGEGLIWVEFTKTTTNERWDNPAHREWKTKRYKKQGHTQIFVPTKNNKDPAYYLYQAHGSNPIQSSIPVSIKRAEKAADEAAMKALDATTKAEEAADSAAKSKQVIERTAVVSALLALASAFIIYIQIVIPTQGLVQDSRPIVQSAVAMYQDQSQRILEVKKCAEDAKSRLEEEEKKTLLLEKQISAIQAELTHLQNSKQDLSAVKKSAQAKKGI